MMKWRDESFSILFRLPLLVFRNVNLFLTLVIAGAKRQYQDMSALEKMCDQVKEIP
jgi:hypothetical protein